MPYNTYNRHSRPSRQNTYFSRSPKRNIKKENIHPSRFIKSAKLIEESPYISTHTFSDFPLQDLLQSNLQSKNFATPSPIQDQAIPMGLSGQDIIGIANTGTGKTIAFAIPVLQKLMTTNDSAVLIMAPTRELAEQIEGEFRQLAKGSGIYGALLIGGSAMRPQLLDLRNNPRVVIGTPGRIKDHLDRQSLNISAFNMVVLDEVDRMLDMGFVQDMTTILAKLASNRQSFFFSATLDAKVKNLIQAFSTDPVTISVKTGDTIDTVEQNIVNYDSRGHKIDTLHDLLISGNMPKVLVFDDTQRNVERLSQELQHRGFQADAIHGGKTQGQRQKALSRFKENKVNILVATDVAARGLDVTDISHVINYSTPQSYDDYVHRIGRTGRAGKTGHALTFIPS